MWGNDLRNKSVFSRWRKTVKEGDDWMSSGREFQRTDAATGNERRPTVDRRNDGTRSEWVDDNRSRRRPGRSAIRVNWLRYGGARPCSVWSWRMCYSAETVKHYHSTVYKFTYIDRLVKVHYVKKTPINLCLISRLLTAPDPDSCCLRHIKPVTSIITITMNPSEH